MPYKKKNGLIVDRLKTVRDDTNINFITDFTDKILPKNQSPSKSPKAFYICPPSVYKLF